MVLFTLTGLNVDVGLYEVVEYPIYDFPDVSASYYLDLSFNPALFDNIFYFKTTSPDLSDDLGTNITMQNLVHVSTTHTVISDTLILNWDNDIDIKIIYNPSTVNQQQGIFDFGHKNKHTNISLRYWATTGNDYNWYPWIKIPPDLIVDDTTTDFRFTPGSGGDAYILASNEPADNIVENENNYFIFKYDSTTRIATFANSNYSSWNSYQGTDDEKWNSVLLNKKITSREIPTLSNSRVNYIFETSVTPRITIGNWNDTKGNHLDGNIIYVNVYNPRPLSDMAFKCESSYWPDISFSQGVISNNTRSDINNYLPPPSAYQVHYNKNIGVQWLAKNITGGYNNSDLFANEEALVQSYIDLDKRRNIVLEGTANVTANFGSYKYYRLVVTSVKKNFTSATDYGYAGLARIRPFDINGNIKIPDEVSNSINNVGSGFLSEATIGGVFSTTLPTSSDTGYVGWIAQGNVYYAGNLTHNHTTLIYTNNTIGEWIQWNYTSSISLSKLEVYLNGYSWSETGNNGDQSTPASLVLFGSNDLNNNWTKIIAWSSGDNNITWKAWFDNFESDTSSEPAIYYTLSLADGVKEEITSSLDLSGGSDAVPLSNVDTGRNNVSREALLHLLDNDISSNVQRVHNMIKKSRTNVDSDGNDISFGDTSNLWIPIEFFDGDIIKFKLIYKPDQITDPVTGAAVDDSGNALGTNIIEDQDYVVRLNIVGKRFDFYHTLSFLSDNISNNNFHVNSPTTRLNIFTESAASTITQITDLVAVIDATHDGDGTFNVGTDVSLGTYIHTGGRQHTHEKLVIKSGTNGGTGVTGLGVNPNGDIRYMLSFIIRLTDVYDGDYGIFETNDGKFKLSIDKSSSGRGYSIRQNLDTTKIDSITLVGDTSNNWKVISVGVDYGIENKIYLYENGVLVTKIDSTNTSNTRYAKAAKDLDIGTNNQWFGTLHFARIDIIEGVHNYGPEYMEYIRETYPDVIF